MLQRKHPAPVLNISFCLFAALSHLPRSHIERMGPLVARPGGRPRAASQVAKQPCSSIRRPRAISPVNPIPAIFWRAHLMPRPADPQGRAAPIRFTRGPFGGTATLRWSYRHAQLTTTYAVKAIRAHTCTSTSSLATAFVVKSILHLLETRAMRREAALPIRNIYVASIYIYTMLSTFRVRGFTLQLQARNPPPSHRATLLLLAGWLLNKAEQQLAS